MPKYVDRFVVRYSGLGQCIYGRDNDDGSSAFVDPMTREEAEAYCEHKMQDSGAKVYELVPVKIKK